MQIKQIEEVDLELKNYIYWNIRRAIAVCYVENKFDLLALILQNYGERLSNVIYGLNEIHPFTNWNNPPIQDIKKFLNDVKKATLKDANKLNKFVANMDIIATFYADNSEDSRPIAGLAQALTYNNCTFSSEQKTLIRSAAKVSQMRHNKKDVGSFITTPKPDNSAPRFLGSSEWSKASGQEGIGRFFWRSIAIKKIDSLVDQYQTAPNEDKLEKLTSLILAISEWQQYHTEIGTSSRRHDAIDGLLFEATQQAQELSSCKR